MALYPKRAGSYTSIVLFEHEYDSIVNNDYHHLQYFFKEIKEKFRYITSLMDGRDFALYVLR